MVKFRARGTMDVATGKDKKVIGLGLSAKNVELLKEGKPIVVKGEEIGLPRVEIFIFYGETEESMKEDLKGFIGPETVVKENG